MVNDYHTYMYTGVNYNSNIQLCKADRLFDVGV